MPCGLRTGRAQAYVVVLAVTAAGLTVSRLRAVATSRTDLLTRRHTH
jgi:hypothetical protein